MYAQTLQFQGHQQSQFRKEGQNFRLVQVDVRDEVSGKQIALEKPFVAKDH
jgi:hypothetical protein